MFNKENDWWVESGGPPVTNEGKIIAFRDVTTGECYLRPLHWWAESTPLGLDRVKVSENVDATAVAPVAPAATSLALDQNDEKFVTDKIGKCVICLDKSSTHAVRPCGHLVACSDCAENLSKECPICRCIISDTLKIFIP